MTAHLLEVLCGNVAVACALGSAAALCARFGRRPWLAHSLYLLALLKLCTPPVLTLGVLPADAAGSPIDAAAPAVATPIDPGEATAAAPRAPAELPVEIATRDVPSPRAPAPSALPWGDLLLWAWLAGSLAVALSMVLRLRAFARALRRARPAPDSLVREARALLPLVGLRRLPAIDVLDAPLPPLCYPSLRGARMLLPERLMAELTPAQRRTILLHELAHLTRRDHWVRLVEIADIVAFFWLPLVWWLRTGLRDAEERSCDGWVVRAAPEHRRAYADALLAVVDSFSHAPLRLPAHASGTSRVLPFKKRLEEIMCSRASPRPGRLARAAVTALALATLPVLPTTFAQDPVGRDPAAPPADPARTSTDPGAQDPQDDDRLLLDRLDRTRIETSFAHADLDEWARFLQIASDVPIVVGPRARAVGASRTTLTDFALPKMSFRQILDVVTATTGLRWRVANGVVMLESAAEPAPPPATVRVFGAGVATSELEIPAGKDTVLAVLSRAVVHDRADLRRVQLVRGALEPDVTKMLLIEVDVDDMLRTGNTTYNLRLQRGDLVIVPRTTDADGVGEKAAEPSEPKLRPGDRVRFLIDPPVLRAPGAELLATLSEPQEVDARGRILVPYIGRLEVEGMNEEAVEDLVRKKLGEAFTFPIVLYARFVSK